LIFVYNTLHDYQNGKVSSKDWQFLILITTWLSRAPTGRPYRYQTECRNLISIVHCSSELLSSNHPPASASRKLGLQVRATTPGWKLSHKSAV
uniref:Uncharacterized protein n=1 Tax=Oryzias latipes TaxID=8090 RepID=A0A3B3IAD3_ORYLA